MPSRMLHEAICTSIKLSRISFEAEVLYYRLQVNADDFGRFYATESIVRNACFTAGKCKPLNVEKYLKELHDAGLIRLYDCDGERYLVIEKWDEKQRQRATKSKFPSPPALADNCGQLTANAPVIVNVNVNEIASEDATESPAKADIKPEVRNSHGENGNIKLDGTEYQKLIDEFGKGDADRFIREADGWVQAKGKQKDYKDWRQIVMNWGRRERKNNPATADTGYRRFGED
jgi:hypothetical protein